jgi:hypothetical protein
MGGCDSRHRALGRAIRAATLSAGNVGDKEKVAFAVVVTLIATQGSSFLEMLQKSIRDQRLELDPHDKDAVTSWSQHWWGPNRRRYP